MEIGGHSPSIQSMAHALANAQQHRAERLNIADQTGGVKEQKVLQQATQVVNASPEGQGNLGSAVMAAQGLATPVGQALRADVTTAHRPDLDTTKHVAGTGKAVASIADAASRAVVAPTANQQADHDPNMQRDRRFEKIPTELLVDLHNAGTQDEPVGTAAFLERNPVFVESPPEIPQIDTNVDLAELPPIEPRAAD